MIQQQENSSESRDRVLNAAYGMFVSHGFAGVSMQQIADAAGITKATLYHHFRDKQDLFTGVARLALTRALTQMRNALATHDSFRDQLLAFSAYCFGADRADIQRVVTDFKTNADPDALEAFWSEFEKPWTFLEASVAQAVARGEIAPIDAGFASRFIFSAANGLAQIYRVDTGITSPHEERPARFVDTILAGLSPR